MKNAKQELLNKLSIYTNDKGVIVNRLYFCLKCKSISSKKICNCNKDIIIISKPLSKSASTILHLLEINNITINSLNIL